MTLLLLAACSSKVLTLPAGADTAVAADTGDSAGDTGGDQETGGDSTADSQADTATEGDADADGWTVEAGDCDDADPLAHPGAEELCDAWDQDCDGDPLRGASCRLIDVDRYTDLPGWAGERSYQYFGARAGSVDAGGGEDLVVGGCYAGPLSDGSLAVRATSVYRDMPEAPGQGWLEGASLVTWPEAPFTETTPTLPLVDHDGDGAVELVMVSPESEDTEGGVFLLDVPTEGRVEAAFDVAAKAMWIAPATGPAFASWVDPVWDVDGDGLADLLVLSETDGTPSVLTVVLGRPGLAGALDALAEVQITGRAGDDWAFDEPSRAHGLPDLDGDGAAEVLVTFGSHRGIGSGATVATSDGASLSEVMMAIVESTADTETTSGYRAPGDWDGDGLGDLAWDRIDDGPDDCIVIAAYTAPFGGDVLEHTLQELCMEGVNTDGALDASHDLDGDGLVDPFFYDRRFWDGTDHVTTHFLVPTSWLDGGRVEIEEVGIRIDADADGEDVVFADLDDDGLPEILWDVSDDGGELVEAGIVRVMQGFPLPWEDAGAWGTNATW